MPSTFSPNLHLELQATGENAGTWGQILDNNVFTIIDQVLGNTLSLPLTNVNVTLSTSQTQNAYINLTGTLTANVQVIFPQIGRVFFIANNTTGAFTVTLTTSAVGGKTYTLQQGQGRFIVLDGTNVLVASDGVGQLTSIASAATTDLGSVLSRNASITGTNTIISFGSSAKVTTPIYQVSFTGSLTITANATSLITPSGGNIYTQAGDSALLLYLGSGNWQILSYSANTFIPGVQPIAGGFKNLVVTATSNSTATITADALTLEDASGRAYRAKNVNLTVNLAASGANGLDTGTETASTWYAGFVIYNQVTNTLAALVSTSATAPTLPSGYTFQGRFFWLRNDASSNLWRTLQKERRTQIGIGTNPASLPILISGNSGNPSTPTWTPVPVGAFVPPTASAIDLLLFTGSMGSFSTAIMAAPNASYGNSNSTTNPPPMMNLNGANEYMRVHVRDMMMLESTNIYYACNIGSGPGLACCGWMDNL